MMIKITTEQAEDLEALAPSFCTTTTARVRWAIEVLKEIALQNLAETELSE